MLRNLSFSARSSSSNLYLQQQFLTVLRSVDMSTPTQTGQKYIFFLSSIKYFKYKQTNINNINGITKLSWSMQVLYVFYPGRLPEYRVSNSIIHNSCSISHLSFGRLLHALILVLALVIHTTHHNLQTA